MAQATQVTLVVLVGITSLLVSVFLWDLLIVRKNRKTPALSFEGRMKNKSNITYVCDGGRFVTGKTCYLGALQICTGLMVHSISLAVVRNRWETYWLRTK